MRRRRSSMLDRVVGFMSPPRSRLNGKRSGSLTKGIRQRKHRDASMARVIEDFANPNFELDVFLQSELGSDLSQILDNGLQSIDYLSRCERATSKHLKEFIGEYYPNFVSCATELASLESDLAECWTALNRYSAALSDLSEIDLTAKESRSAVDPPRWESCSVTSICSSDHSDGSLPVYLQMLEQVQLLSHERKWCEAISVLCVLKRQLNSHRKYDWSIPTAQIRGLFDNIQRRQMMLFSECCKELRKCSAHLTHSYSSGVDPTMVDRQRREQLRLFAHSLKLGPHFERVSVKVFLECKSEESRRMIRQIRVIGDLQRYVFDLCNSVLSLMRVSLLQFQTVIEQSELDHPSQHLSALTAWLAEQTHCLAMHFETQVFLNDTPLPLVGSCLRICFGLFSKTHEFGISLWPHLREHLAPAVRSMVSKAMSVNRQRIDESISVDDWRAKLTEIADSKKSSQECRMSESAVILFRCSSEFLYSASHLFSASLFPWMTESLLPLMVAELVALVQHYCAHITQVSRSADLRHSQRLSLIRNTAAVCEHLMPRVERTLRDRYRCSQTVIHSIQQSVSEMTQLNSAQTNYSAKRIALTWVRQCLGFGSALPERYRVQSESQDISAEAIQVSTEITQVCRLIRQFWNSHDRVLSRFMGELVSVLTVQECWQFAHSGSAVKLDPSQLNRSLQGYSLNKRITSIIDGYLPGYPRLDCTPQGCQRLTKDLTFLVETLEQLNTGTDTQAIRLLCARLQRRCER